MARKRPQGGDEVRSAKGVGEVIESSGAGLGEKHIALLGEGIGRTSLDCYRESNQAVGI